MIEFKPLELSDKEIIENHFSKTNFNNAEKNFSNLFMWRHTYDYEYALINDCLCIKGKSRETKTPFCHFPYGNCKIQSPLPILEEAFKKEGQNLIIKPLLPEMKECLEKATNNFEIIEDRDSFDYVYTSEKLIHLKGKKLRTKRRWVKKFTENYNYSYEKINEENLKEAKEFTLNIIKNTNNDEDEIIAMGEMFDNFFVLGITGCIVRVDGKVVGVSTGEALTEDTVLIHCERCSQEYEGIYNFINQEFCKREWSDYTYINREEDLGIEGLRYAKLTYRPDNLLSKYIAKRKTAKESG